MCNCTGEEDENGTGSDSEKETLRGEESRRSSKRTSRSTDSAWSASEKEDVDPFDEDFVVISNKHVGCCYGLNYGIWVTFGGAIMFLMWALMGLICCCTVIGMGWGFKCFSIATIVLVPWKHKNRGVVKKNIYYIENPEPKYWGIVLWWIVCGLILTVLHLVFAALTFVTFIGMPFTYQHIKFIQMIWKPGHICLTLDECEAIVGRGDVETSGRVVEKPKKEESMEDKMMGVMGPSASTQLGMAAMGM
ncbi:unnamed protein product [Amoebophrya sp. A25]|nr:unnamed protein product [Amoebophrya sp. A25]|eukprot:GSA25T00012684001.1